MAMVKYVLLIPFTYNDHSRAPKSVLNGILDDLYLLAGGYHIVGVGEGAYRMRNGSKQVDQSLEIWVVIEEEFAPSLRGLIEKFVRLLHQETIYLERAGGSVEFVTPARGGGEIL
jgi:hypothetical protein